jgi:hypothetical protein
MSRSLLSLALLGLLATWSASASAFYCGTHLVHEGDTRAEVRAKCGDPTDVETKSILRQPIFFLRGRPVVVGSGFVEVPVEFWLYNLGPHRLMRRLRFEDGKLIEIETLGHGFLQN